MTARSVGMALVVLGAVATGVAFIASGDVTVRMTAGMAYGIGLVILAIAEVIIVTTRRQAPRASR